MGHAGLNCNHAATPAGTGTGAGAATAGADPVTSLGFSCSRTRASRRIRPMVNSSSPATWNWPSVGLLLKSTRNVTSVGPPNSITILGLAIAGILCLLFILGMYLWRSLRTFDFGMGNLPLSPPERYPASAACSSKSDRPSPSDDQPQTNGGYLGSHRGWYGGDANQGRPVVCSQP